MGGSLKPFLRVVHVEVNIVHVEELVAKLVKLVPALVAGKIGGMAAGRHLLSPKRPPLVHLLVLSDG